MHMCIFSIAEGVFTTEPETKGLHISAIHHLQLCHLYLGGISQCSANNFFHMNHDNVCYYLHSTVNYQDE